MSETTTAQVNPAKVIYDQVSVEKKLGSRITRRQMAAVLGTDERPTITRKSLLDYAVSGDNSGLKEAEVLELRGFVARCKEHEVLGNESQRRRLWPRKVAAILAFTKAE